MKDKSVRCDQCGAEAWVVLEKLMQPFMTNSPVEIPVPYQSEERPQLSFCAHDYDKNSFGLSTKGWHVISDERASINTKPSVSV